MTDEWRNVVERGDVPALERLLAAGADVDARDGHGQTGLMLAARAGGADTVRALLRHRAALNHTAKYGLSALMLAALNGHLEVVRLLVEAGADRTLRGTGAPGFFGKTAADLAAERGDAPMRKVLER